MGWVEGFQTAWSCRFPPPLPAEARLSLSAAFALPSGGPKLLPGLSLSKGACSGSQCAAVNTALCTAQISPSLIELPSTQRVPPEDLIFQGRTRSREAEKKKSVIFPLACDVRAAQLSVTDASLGTWSRRRCSARAPGRFRAAGTGLLSNESGSQSSDIRHRHRWRQVGAASANEQEKAC